MLTNFSVGLKFSPNTVVRNEKKNWSNLGR